MRLVGLIIEKFKFKTLYKLLSMSEREGERFYARGGGHLVHFKNDVRHNIGRIKSV